MHLALAESLFITDINKILLILLSTFGIFVTVITYTRIAGLRSFSKMTGFDFAMTVAVGSLMATVALTEVSLSEGAVALAGLYGTQVVIAILRKNVWFKKIVDNTPTLLVHDGIMMRSNMKRTRITDEDIHSKLREANVAKLSEVNAVVLETTGDISVIHGKDIVDDTLLKNVTGRQSME